MQNDNVKPQKPLIKLTLIVIPTIIVVLITLFLLNDFGVFTSAETKLCTKWERTRKGTYSSEKYTEMYNFFSDGTGYKLYTDPDGYSARNDFTWDITQNDTLIINGHVKYQWNGNFADYYKEKSSAAKKYWYVSKNELYFGEDTSLTYEVYNRKK